ncbi:PREDICTED: CASP-like protein 2C1 [Nelumbo nucifera]|uniref:CASP-like protein n=1 Tax=Nelumbo nucifera TaxID=4432 RepID=A0A1U8AED9_NELNU|nr:PREDICTED: CASP-like protein 2C1 [Nelumbo nucifera]
MLKIEALLRLFTVGLLVLTACLVGTDKQTKTVFFSVERKATVKDLDALVILMIVETVVAFYHLLQLGKCFFFPRFKENKALPYSTQAWVFFFLDQTVTYIYFGATIAAAQASALSVTGASDFQWMKVCNIYTRFCIQIGGSLFCGLVAALLMSIVSSISAFNLFRHYSPKQFFALKG